jgi:hypothetical protein
MPTTDRTSILILLAGDGFGFALITLVGFASHDSLSLQSIGRMLTTFLTFFAAWLLILPWFGLQHVHPPARTVLWRVPLAALFSAPMGGWLRGLVLNAPIQPVFILVMAGMIASGMCVWRLAATRLLNRPFRT